MSTSCFYSQRYFQFCSNHHHTMTEIQILFGKWANMRVRPGALGCKCAGNEKTTPLFVFKLDYIQKNNKCYFFLQDEQVSTNGSVLCLLLVIVGHLITCFVQFSTQIGKLQPAGHMQPVKLFNLTHKAEINYINSPYKVLFSL